MLDTFLNALKVNAFVIVLTIVVGFIIAKLIIAILDKAISKLRVEKTLLRFFRSVVRVIVYFIWILVVEQEANFDAKYRCSVPPSPWLPRALCPICLAAYCC